MRPIKFRAWDSKQKRFGYIQITPYGINIEDVESVEQFTGLLDKSGREIYEGDIIRHPKSNDLEDIGFIFYSDNFAMFKIDQAGKHYELWDGINMSGMEVVGNIHEHPALLKEVKA